MNIELAFLSVITAAVWFMNWHKYRAKLYISLAVIHLLIALCSVLPDKMIL